MNLEDMLSEKANTVSSHLYEVSRVVRFIEIENRMVIPRICEEERIGSCLMGRVSVLQDEHSILDWLYSSVNAPNAIELCS